MYELARSCKEFQGLPVDGGVGDQPYGALVEMRYLIGYARDFARFDELGKDAPKDLRTRIMSVHARAFPPVSN